MRHHFLPAFLALALATPFAVLPAPATAQGKIGSPSFQFLKAVEDRDGDTATRLIEEGGPILLNSRGREKGEGALHLVVRERDPIWLGFLLQKGANPNLETHEGLTPLMQATQPGWIEGMDWLIRYTADVDRPNRSGETALIRAVQLKNQDAARMLLKAGADPDHTDSLTGMSARDYAIRDGRSSSMVALLASEAQPKRKAAVQGPTL